MKDKGDDPMPVDNYPQSISFGSYQSPLKTLYKKGKMPKVVKGIYGDVLDTANASLEHLRPVSKGGKTDLANLALASKNKNAARGNQPLKNVLDWEMVEEYLSQFDFKIKGFNGPTYQALIRKTCKKLGIPDKLPKKGLDIIG